MAKRDFGLDMVRALAIIMVLFSHLFSHLLKLEMGYAWYLPLLGVDIFFALSGILIGDILIRSINSDGVLNLKNAYHFLIRRFFRTAPLYLIILFINYFLYRYFYKTINSFHWNYLFWLQGFSKDNFPFFGESWSLCIEEWFYLSYAIGLSLFTVLARNWQLLIKYKVLIFTSLYIFIFTILRLLSLSKDYINFRGSTTIFRLDTIGCGVLMAVFYHYFNIQINKKWVLLSGGLISFIGILCFMLRLKIHIFYLLSYSLICIGIAFCVLFVKMNSFNFIKNIYSKTIVFISKISYSIYLLNFIIIDLVNHFLYPILSLFNLFMLSLVLIITLSYITYRFIEIPFLKIRNKHFSYKAII